MILATHIQPETGEIREVIILDGNKEAHTALISPKSNGLGNWGDGQFWKNAPVWTVDQGELVDIRLVCWECGEEFDPSRKTCPVCGERISDPLTDEQDSEDTFSGLAAEYAGGML